MPDISLLASPDPEDRQFAVDHILEERGSNEFGDDSVRPRVTPKINLSATSLTTLISWKKGQVESAPLVSNIQFLKKF